MIVSKRTKERRKRPEMFHQGERLRFIDKRTYITKGGRVRCYGADYTALQIAAFQRSNGKCECGCGRPAPWASLSERYVPIEAKGEVSHNEHGARKSDELSRVKWMRHECHMKFHNAGGKPIAVRKRDIKMEVA